MAVKWCCGGFEAHISQAGHRGSAIVATSEPDGRASFKMQHRVVDMNYDVAVRAALGATNFPVSLVTQIVVRFCPWCGRDLGKVYSKAISELTSLQADGLLISQSPHAPKGATSGLRTWQEAGIGADDALRIQNAANKTGQRITVVGSRAEGTAGEFSDWDFVLSGPSKARHSARSSLPTGQAGGEMATMGRETGIDIWQNYNSKAPSYTKVKSDQPHVNFDPE